MSCYEGIVNLPGEMVPVGSAEELAVQTAVVQAAALPATATHALVCVKLNPVHVTFDGSTPADGGAGMRLTNGLAPMVWAKEALVVAKFIRAAGANAIVTIQGMAPR